MSRVRSLTDGATRPKGLGSLFRRLSLRTQQGSWGYNMLEEDTSNLVEASNDTQEDVQTRQRRDRYRAYDSINGPLTDPEPFQVTGVGSLPLHIRPSPAVPSPSEKSTPFRSSSDPVEYTIANDSQESIATFSSGRQPIRTSPKPYAQNDTTEYTSSDYSEPSDPGPDAYYPHRISSYECLQRYYYFAFGSTRIIEAEDSLSRQARGLHPSPDSPYPSPPSTPENMSQRPLDQIRRDVKTANRTPHLRKKNFVATDTIDQLDDIGIGGAYHHEGPFDATLASRNRDKRYAPVDAVKTTNMEALRATPREFVQDSLQKHVPLQGTAVVPPGEEDMFGRKLSYEEGADLMREEDAPGGAYKRYPHVQYSPNDFKGKGEPSFTRDLDEKSQKRHRKQLASTGSGGAVYEMQPTSHHRSSGSRGKERGAAVRQRSTSDVGPGPSGYQQVPRGDSRDVDTGRTSTSGKRLSDGLKRRIGSLRNKLRDDE